jgi:aminopeptidase
MSVDPRVQKLAEIVVGYAVGVRPGDCVVTTTTTSGEPLARACQDAILKVGGHPSTILESEAMQEGFLRHAGDDQLRFPSPFTRVMAQQADCIITILAPSAIRPFAGIDRARLALRDKATQHLREIVSQREQSGELRRTITQYPTEAAAQRAGMSGPDYEEFVYDAAFLDEEDPVAAWRALSRRQQRLIEWLSDKRTIRVVAPGVDLTVSVAGRTWINSDGHRNFPSGEVFTGPIESLTSGSIAFNCPAYIHGNEVSDVRLAFDRGVVVEASAGLGDEVLQEMLRMDDGARRLGEFAFGTNDRIQTLTGNTLFDEKIGGTLHMALGRSYPETGGTNASALHWDMVYDLRGGGDVFVDGQLFSRDGVFQI